MLQKVKRKNKDCTDVACQYSLCSFGDASPLLEKPAVGDASHLFAFHGW